MRYTAVREKKVTIGNTRPRRRRLQTTKKFLQMHHPPLPGKPINFSFLGCWWCWPFWVFPPLQQAKVGKRGKFKRLSVGVDSCLIDYRTRTCHVASPTQPADLLNRNTPGRGMRTNIYICRVRVLSKDIELDLFVSFLVQL